MLWKDPVVQWLTSTELNAIGLSLAVAAGSTLACVVPGIALGWLLARCQFRGKWIVDTLVHLPLVLPPVAVGYLLLIVLGRQGVVGRWLYEHLGVQLVFTWSGAVVAAAVMALPLMVRAVRLAITLVDPRLEQAAGTLGAGRLRVFLTITLPLARTGIATGVLLAFARSLGEFGATITFVGNFPGETSTIPLAMFTALQTPGGDAQAWRLMVVAMALSFMALACSEWINRRMRAHGARG